MTNVPDNNDLMLVLPSLEYADAISDFRSEMLEGNSSMDGCGPLKRTADPAEFVQRCNDNMDWSKTADNLVPASIYLCIRKSDGKVVGFVQIRHYLNWYLYKVSGHIGYSVRPSERRKGYAKWILRSALGICAEMGMARVMVCCLDDNEASRRTILANGGIFFGTTVDSANDRSLEMYWVPTGLEKPQYKELPYRERTVALMLMSLFEDGCIEEVYGIDLESSDSHSSDVVVRLKEGYDLNDYSKVYVENGFEILACSEDEVLLGYAYCNGKPSEVSFELHLRH